METQQELDIAKTQVEELLKRNPITRGNNKLFIIAVMQTAGVELTTHQVEIIKQMFAFETYTRAKRDLQEQGKYLPDKRTQRLLNEKEQEVRRHFGKQKRQRRSRGQLKLHIEPNWRDIYKMVDPMTGRKVDIH